MPTDLLCVFLQSRCDLELGSLVDVAGVKPQDRAAADRLSFTQSQQPAVHQRLKCGQQLRLAQLGVCVQ